jgi:hypothetical protein
LDRYGVNVLSTSLEEAMLQEPAANYLFEDLVALDSPAVHWATTNVVVMDEDLVDLGQVEPCPMCLARVVALVESLDGEEEDLAVLVTCK